MGEVAAQDALLVIPGNLMAQDAPKLHLGPSGRVGDGLADERLIVADGIPQAFLPLVIVRRFLVKIENRQAIGAKAIPCRENIGIVFRG